MALPQLTTNLNIVSALADLPNATDGLTAAQLKAKFDEGPNAIKSYLNTILLAALQATTDGSSGADNIGTTAITGLSGTTVQSLLESLRDKLKSVADGSSGADFVNATAIPGLSGGTVQALLESLKTKTDADFVSKSELTNTRKLDASGNFTGSWFGFTTPTASDPGIQNQVDANTAQLADFVNVMYPPAPYVGAKGDGETDDTAAIQALLTNGYNLFIPTGHTFIVSGLLITHEFASIIGGGFSSIIKQKSGTTATPVIQTNSDYTSISNLCIQGDWDTEHDTSDGFYASLNYSVNNVFFFQVNGNAIKTGGAGYGTITSVTVYRTRKNGFYLAADNVVTGCNIGTTGEHGIYITGGHNAISGCEIWMSGDKNLVGIENDSCGIRILGEGNSITACTIIASCLHGISATDAYQLSITGCVVDQNGRGAHQDNDAAGFYARNLTDSTVIITSVNSGSFPPSPESSFGWQKYGIFLENRNGITGNVIKVSTDADIDIPLYSDGIAYPRLYLGYKNDITITTPDGVTERFFTSLPSAVVQYKGQSAILSQSGTDRQYTCIEVSTDVYSWRPLVNTNRYKKGTMTDSGDGSTTVFTIAHGLGETPDFYDVTVASAAAGAAEISYVTADATNLTVTFKTAPTSGSSNIKLVWKAEIEL